MQYKFFNLAALTAAALIATAHAQEGPPTVNGVIKDPNLVQNQNIAKAQAVGAITTFMSKGAQECDADGKNCRSLFGNDDSMDYSSMQLTAKTLTGVDSYSFAGGDDSSNSVSSQLGTLAIACGDKSVKLVAGVAVKVLSCSVAANGNAQARVQVCTAPGRGNPVKNPDNAVPCSSDPSAPNFKAPIGQVCMKPACDTEPENSLNGWSSPATINWTATLPETATETQKSNNGLALVFYPALNGGITPDFKADSDNMTALKIVQSFKDNETGNTAIGLRIAYRYKVQLTKDMLTKGAAAVPNPKDHSSAWETIEKLQGNALIPQYQAQYAANGSECIQQIQNGIASDGIISVCDQGYTNESGIRPLALTAQVATEGQDCSSVPQCLKEVVNTNTWTESCSADVPLAMRNCTTKQDYTMEKVSYTRTRTSELCNEERLTAEHGCTTTSSVASVSQSLTCTPKFFRCMPGASECCTFTIECPGSEVKVTYQDCCGYVHVRQASSVEEFVGAGFQYNWNPQSRIRCTTDGYCTIDFTNYFCEDPTYVLDFAPNVNQFSFTKLITPIYSTSNACTAYEAAR